MTISGWIPERAATALIALLVAACSTADYSKPVNDFAAATADARITLAELNSQITTAYTDVLRQSVLDRRHLLTYDEGNCAATKSTRCRLVVVDVVGEDEEVVSVYPPDPVLDETTLLMSEISAYAANLKALLEADTAEKVTAQVNAALGSIQNLAGTVAELNEQPNAPAVNLPQFATPVGALVNWVVGQYIEHVKLQGLQHATAQAKPHIRNAADLFKKISDTASAISKTRLAEEVQDAADPLSDSLSAAAIANAVKVAATYDALLTSAPPEVFELMGDAHDALADSLQGEGTTFSQAVAKIEKFGMEAQKLAQILKDLRAIAPPDTED